MESAGSEVQGCVTRRDATSRAAVQSLHQNGSATWLNGYLADTTTRARHRLPLGAPVFTGLEAWPADGHTEYSFGKTLHTDARVTITVPRDAAQVILVRDDQAALSLIGDVVASHAVTAEVAYGRLVLERVTGSIIVSWSESR